MGAGGSEDYIKSAASSLVLHDELTHVDSSQFNDATTVLDKL